MYLLKNVCVPDILSKSSSLITDKIKTHSRKGFSVYLKCFFCKCIQLNMFNTKLLNMFNKLCFVIHGALWTLALFGPIFGQGEGYYIRSYYYILYPCSPLILTFLIYLICVSVFALIHRLHSYLSTSPSALMLLFYYWPSFCLSVFPATYAVFQKLIYYFIVGWPAWKRLIISLLQISFAFFIIICMYVCFKLK